MTKPAQQPTPPTEDEVLRRMLNTPHKEHKPKPVPAKKQPKRKTP